MSTSPAEGHDVGDGQWFAMERFRASAHRIAEVRKLARPTVVLGSTQMVDVVDQEACALAGVEVVRRRSGGGLVFLDPSDPIWCDLWVPRGDPLWDDDVGSATWWVGELWASALCRLGAASLDVHHRGMVAGPLSDVVCFAGIGPGEVTAAGRKVVGVAQWRCREGALFHTAAYRRWEPARLRPLLRGQPDPVGLEQAAMGLVELLGRDEAPARVVDCLVDALPAGSTWDLRRA